MVSILQMDLNNVINTEQYINVYPVHTFGNFIHNYHQVPHIYTQHCILLTNEDPGHKLPISLSPGQFVHRRDCLSSPQGSDILRMNYHW